jgi:hypothetical protein
MPPQTWPGIETSIVIVAAPDQLFDELADAAAKQRAEQLAPAPADLALMLDHDQLKPLPLGLGQSGRDFANALETVPGAGVEMIGEDRLEIGEQDSHLDAASDRMSK